MGSEELTQRNVRGEGARVVISDIDGPLIAEVEGAIRDRGGTVASCVGSVASWTDAARLVGCCVSAFGGLDAIVNNAGVHYMTKLEAEDPDEAQRMVEVNILGTIYPGLCAIRQMLQQDAGGVVLNVSSGAAAGMAMAGTYCATKGAVSSLTWAWALELRERGIRVNTIAPAAFTQMVERSLPGRPSTVDWSPTVIAPLVVFLLSGRSREITGQVVRLWGTDLHLMRHHGPMSPLITRDDWSVVSLSDAFDRTLRPHLQPYGREMTEFLAMV